MADLLPTPSIRATVPGRMGLRGRTAELAAIDAALVAARDSRGSTLAVSGPPGRGVSALLAEAATRARSLGLVVLEAEGRAGERALPLALALALLEPAVPSGTRGAPAPHRLTPLLRLLDGDDVLADGGHSVLRAAWWLLTELAADDAGAGGRPRGVAIVVDALHDADAHSLRLLAYLAARARRAPVCIVVGLRTDRTAGDPAALAAVRDAAVTLEPAPLAPEDVATIVRAVLPGASEQACRVCAMLCGGNPGRLSELLDALGDEPDGIHTGDGGLAPTLEPERIAAVVPRATVASLHAELDRMPPGARGLAVAVAMLGDGVALDRAAAAARLGPAEAAPLLDALAAAEVLAAELPLRYAHPLTRAAAVSSAGPGTRAAIGRGRRAAGRPARAERPPSAGNPPAQVADLATLTRSERRIAELAARGSTTREIADTLYVTPKTVEFHLRNIYRKLELPSSRAELARAVGSGAGELPAPSGPAAEG